MTTVTEQPLLKDLPQEKGFPIAHLLRISNIEMRQAKNGKDYIQFSLGDKSMEIKAKKWDSSTEEFERFKKCKVVFVTGKTDTYNNALTIVCDTVAEPEDGTETEQLETLLPKTPYDVNFLKKGIWSLIQKMENPWIKKLCEAFLADTKFKERFLLVPGGISRHDSFRNGLLQHTFRLMTLASDFVDSYNRHSWPGNKIIVDKDAVLGACFLHDAMKSFEYLPDMTYAPEGNMLGHIARCIMEIGSKTAKIENFPDEIKDLLCHCVSSHHGLVEWGSPDTFCCPEAVITHYLDDLLSKLDPTILELNTITSLEDKWTKKKVKQLDKPAHLGNSKIMEIK